MPYPSSEERRHARPTRAAALATAGATLALLLTGAASADAATAAVTEVTPGAVPAADTDHVTDLSVLTFNLWHGGTKIDDGPQVIADIITGADADVVFTPEKGSVTKEIADMLGFSFVDATDTGIISRYPILESGTVGDDWTKAVLDVDGVETVVYGGHLEYRWYANYLPRGYGGEILGDHPEGWDTWDQLAAPVTDVEQILQASNESDRPEQAALVVADAAREREAGRLTILGGDFNEPSGMDWTEATADMFGHAGTVIDWPALRVILDDGMVDSYREAHPDPVTHPGITWSIENPAFDPLELTWTPEADERDRIDFVFYTPDPRLELRDSIVVGPQGSIIRGEVVGKDSDDVIVTPPGEWPSDHKAVLSTFSVCAGGCADDAAAPAPQPEPGLADPSLPDPAAAADTAPERLAATGGDSPAPWIMSGLALLLAGTSVALLARRRTSRPLRGL